MGVSSTLSDEGELGKRRVVQLDAQSRTVGDGQVALVQLQRLDQQLALGRLGLARCTPGARSSVCTRLAARRLRC